MPDYSTRELTKAILNFQNSMLSIFKNKILMCIFLLGTLFSLFLMSYVKIPSPSFAISCFLFFVNLFGLIYGMFYTHFHTERETKKYYLELKRRLGGKK